MLIEELKLYSHALGMNVLLYLEFTFYDAESFMDVLKYFWEDHKVYQYDNEHYAHPDVQILNFRIHYLLFYVVIKQYVEDGFFQ